MHVSLCDWCSFGILLEKNAVKSCPSLLTSQGLDTAKVPRFLEDGGRGIEKRRRNAWLRSGECDLAAEIPRGASDVATDFSQSHPGFANFW